MSIRGFEEVFFFFFSSRRRHTRCGRDWSSDVCSSDLVFVVAGLGGGAGTGAAPIVARAARANGAVTIGIAILPFEIEGRSALAQEGLEEFRREADSVVVVDNNSLDRFADQLSFNEAMQVVSYMVVTIVKGVVDHLSKSYLTT